MKWSEATRDSVVGVAAIGGLVAIVWLVLNQFDNSRDVTAILGVVGTMFGTVIGAAFGHVTGQKAGEETGRKQTLADLKTNTVGKSADAIAAHVAAITS